MASDEFQPFHPQFQGLSIDFTGASSDTVATWAPAANVVRSENRTAAVTLSSAGCSDTIPILLASRSWRRAADSPDRARTITRTEPSSMPRHAFAKGTIEPGQSGAGNGDIAEQGDGRRGDDREGPENAQQRCIHVAGPSYRKGCAAELRPVFIGFFACRRSRDVRLCPEENHVEIRDVSNRSKPRKTASNNVKSRVSAGTSGMGTVFPKGTSDPWLKRR